MQFSFMNHARNYSHKTTGTRIFIIILLSFIIVQSASYCEETTNDFLRHKFQHRFLSTLICCFTSRFCLSFLLLNMSDDDYDDDDDEMVILSTLCRKKMSGNFIRVLKNLLICHKVNVVRI